MGILLVMNNAQYRHITNMHICEKELVVRAIRKFKYLGLMWLDFPVRYHNKYHGSIWIDQQHRKDLTHFWKWLNIYRKNYHLLAKLFDRLYDKILQIIIGLKLQGQGQLKGQIEELIEFNDLVCSYEGQQNLIDSLSRF